MERVCETPLTRLMRTENFTHREAVRDFNKRYVSMTISFDEHVQKWRLSLIKNSGVIFEKLFSKTCHSAILEWFIVYDLDRDELGSIKIPWKQIRGGRTFAASVYINRRIWRNLELPREWQLCDIYFWRPRVQERIGNSAELRTESGVVLPLFPTQTPL